MTGISDDGETANGHQIVQIHRRFTGIENPPLGPDERRQLLDAVEHGNIRDVAEKLGLRCLHVMYCMTENGLKATVAV